jgi:hypothetical protein
MKPRGGNVIHRPHGVPASDASKYVFGRSLIDGEPTVPTPLAVDSVLARFFLSDRLLAFTLAGRGGECVWCVRWRDWETHLFFGGPFFVVWSIRRMRGRRWIALPRSRHG